MPRPTQADLLAGGGMTLRLKLKVGGFVRVRTTLRSGGRSRRLGPDQQVLLFAHRWRTVMLPLDARGRALLARCRPGRLSIRVQSPAAFAGSRTVSRHMRVTAPGCRRFFAPSSFWNTPLAAKAPLDPESSQVTQQLLREVRAGLRSKFPPTINTDQYTPGLYTVPSDEPRVRVALDGPPDREPALRAAFASVPLPPTARPSAGSDGELVVWQPATDTMWEFWRFRRAAGGWVASWGGRMRHVSRSRGVFLPPHANWGTSASSLALVGGLILPAELESGKVDHALALGIPGTRAHEFALPAQRTDGRSRCRYAVPEGARFRLDPKLDVASLRLPPAVATLARAAQRYGIVVREQSGAVAFYAQNTSSLPSDPYPNAFGGRSAAQLVAQFPWSRLVLTRMRLRDLPGGGVVQLPGGLGCV